jgi:hypothetical protein
MEKALIVELKKSPDGTLIASVLPNGSTVLQKGSPEMFKFFQLFTECYVAGCNCTDDGTTWGNHIPSNKVTL